MFSAAKLERVQLLKYLLLQPISKLTWQLNPAMKSTPMARPPESSLLEIAVQDLSMNYDLTSKQAHFAERTACSLLYFQIDNIRERPNGILQEQTVSFSFLERKVHAKSTFLPGSIVLGFNLFKVHNIH